MLAIHCKATIMKLADYIEINDSLKAAFENPAAHYRMILNLISSEFKIDDSRALLEICKLKGKYITAGPKIMKVILSSNDTAMVSQALDYIFNLYPDSDLEANELFDILIINLESQPRETPVPPALKLTTITITTIITPL